MNKKTFITLLSPLEPKLFGFAFRMLRDEEMVRDAMQELMLRLWKNRKKLDQNQNISAYCFRAMNNICIDALRQTGRHLATDFAEEHAGIPELQSNSPELLHDQKELVARIRQVVELLPVKQRTIIELHDFQEFSHTEIAEIMEMEINAVRTNLSRARARITAQIKKEEVYE